MLSHRLAGSKATRDAGRTAFCNGEHRIQNPLSGNQRPGCRIAQADRSRNSDGPLLHHRKFFEITVFLSYGNQRFIDGIVAVADCLFDDTLNSGRHHAPVSDGGRLRHLGNHIPRFYLISRRYGDLCFPAFLIIQGIYLSSPADIFSGLSGNLFERAFNSVKDIMENSRCQ